MGKTEAFCTQCGSLINIDDSKDKNKCLFCGTEIVTTKALDLKSDPKTRAMLQKEAEQKAIEAAKAKKEQQKQNKGPRTDVAVAAPTHKQVVVITPIPFKTKMTMLAILVGIVLVLTGIFVPTILSRNAKREVLTSQLIQKISFNIKDSSEGIAYNHNDNRELLLVTDADITEKSAKEAYQTYLAIYENAYGISAEKAQNKITLMLYAKNGLFQCKTKDGVVTAVFETATPTPTPTPTLSPTAASAAAASAAAASAVSK